jgi:hypothetical protein
MWKIDFGNAELNKRILKEELTQRVLNEDLELIEAIEEEENEDDY